ncbi:hypothetical protein JCM3775_002758 [Rhodotorula graminis]|uniref:Uncharacterized protein n=1 Tax=Rhodotorula graminis (strain WP1) TaxID=578459 RepID=A0A0P9ESR6_RHOGW|nr:uncharacterized protein RHOBADRAFT_55813 [Rhodotorula graminis WP1]KPV72329.1 hypothetical protein RHOBADRAFT_55813 [Rhodotorula graminis WP1]
MPHRALALLVAGLALVSLAQAASPATDTADIFLPDDSARQHAARPVVYTASSEPTAPSLLDDDAEAPLEPASDRIPLPFRLPHGPRRLKRSTAADLVAFPELERRAEPNRAALASSIRASRSAAQAAAAAAGGGSPSSAVAPAPAVPETTTTAQLPGSEGVVSTGLLTRATASAPPSAAASATSAPVESDAASDSAEGGAGGATVTAFETASTGVVVTSFASASAGTLESALEGSSSASSEPATALVNAAARASAVSRAGVGVAAAGALGALMLLR